MLQFSLETAAIRGVFFPAKNTYAWKRFNAQSAIKRTTPAGCDRELFGIGSAVISIETLIIVWYVEV